MTVYQVERVIEASPETLWQCLTDAQALASGPCGITAIKGQIGAGEKITLYAQVSGSRGFKLKVTRFEPHHHMEWTGGMPLGLFKGVRSFRLTPTDGGTRFEMQEVFLGPLASMIRKSIPDLTGSFQTFADGLAQLAKERSI